MVITKSMERWSPFVLLAAVLLLWQVVVVAFGIPDPDVQRLTWESYMNKELVRSDPMAHVRVFMKDVAHLLELVTPWRSKRQ